jgi:hypothetical protein
VTQQTQEQRTQEAADRFIGSVHSAMSTWEQTNKARDPDWNLKSDIIAEKLELVFLKNGANVKSPQEAVQIANQILQDVNKQFQRFKPAPRAVTPVTGGSSSPRSAPEPKTMLDVVRMGMGL